MFSSSSKRLSKQIDGINDLPDYLITDEILPRLMNTRCSIQTGILSKRWENLWKFVPYLHFDDESFRKSAINGMVDIDVYNYAFSDFYIAVDRCLGQIQLESLNKLEFNASYDCRFYSYVKNWIEFAANKRVKHFIMYLRNAVDDNEFLIDNDSFYMNSEFTYIHVAFCTLNPFAVIQWNNLTSLTLSNMKLDNDLIQHIEFGSPILETLTFKSCIVSLIDIQSKSIKNLIIVGHQHENDGDILEINAPNATFLSITGEMYIHDIIIQDVMSLMRAQLDYIIPAYSFEEYESSLWSDHFGNEESILIHILDNMNHVKEVEVGYFCNLVLSRLKTQMFTIPENLTGVNITNEEQHTNYNDLEDRVTKLEELFAYFESNKSGKSDQV